MAYQGWVAAVSEERKFAVLLLFDGVLTTQCIGQMVASRDVKRVIIECLLVSRDKKTRGKSKPLIFLIT
jgi:hypothetical protein